MGKQGIRLLTPLLSERTLHSAHIVSIINGFSFFSNDTTNSSVNFNSTQDKSCKHTVHCSDGHQIVSRGPPCVERFLIGKGMARARLVIRMVTTVYTLIGTSTTVAPWWCKSSLLTEPQADLLVGFRGARVNERRAILFNKI